MPSNLDESLGILEAAAQRNDRAAILRGLQALIPKFTPVGTPVVGVGAEGVKGRRVLFLIVLCPISTGRRK